MTRTIRFSRFRVIFPLISFAIIAAGLAFTFSTGGLNLGIDFQPGLNIRLQIAPVGARISYTGEGTSTINILNGEITVTTTNTEGVDRSSFLLADFATTVDLQAALQTIPGLSLEAMPITDSPSQYLPLERETELSSIPLHLNVAPGVEDVADIGEVRAALQPIGEPRIQTIGDANANEFMIRIEESEGATDFDTEITARVADLLEGVYGVGTALVRQTDYIGARLSANLAQQSVYLSLLALFLILAYTWFRFRLTYAVSAIVALLHDSLFMFAFIGVIGLEFSTATIAAVLTIIGYSLNDTIVIFDRIRENSTLLRDEEFRSIADTSITQSLSRTIVTSVTTLLAVVSIYVFGTGSIRDFALAMIVGVVVGTYSSIFVAAPILAGWTAISARRKKSKDAARFHVKPADGEPETASEKSDDEPTQSEQAREIPVIERRLKGKRKKR